MPRSLGARSARVRPGPTSWSPFGGSPTRRATLSPAPRLRGPQGASPSVVLWLIRLASRTVLSPTGSGQLAAPATASRIGRGSGRPSRGPSIAPTQSGCLASSDAYDEMLELVRTGSARCRGAPRLLLRRAAGSRSCGLPLLAWACRSLGSCPLADRLLRLARRRAALLLRSARFVRDATSFDASELGNHGRHVAPAHHPRAPTAQQIAHSWRSSRCDSRRA